MDLLRRVRQADGKTPVLVITARADPGDRIRCLDLGADDCLTKHVDVEEWMARLRALARRSGISPGGRLQVGSLEIDLLQRTATGIGLPVGLAGREYVVLHLCDALKQATAVWVESGRGAAVRLS
jgi:DNA-binding response OmpR family regulator